MNYGILLRVKIEENQWITLGDKHIVSWDIRDLILASSGWSVLNHESAGAASSLIPKLKRGIIELTHHAPSYISYEILHGLGTIKEILDFYHSLLADCEGHPFAELYGQIVD